MKYTTNHTLTVSSEAQQALPAVLVDYLWDLAENGIYGQDEEQFFTLTLMELGGRLIQEVEHFRGGGKVGLRHKVFGFEPVAGTVQVSCDGMMRRMSLT